ncbi:hypothetical protein VPNG_05363 [Cytospora leucostoma]|uniref:Peptidase A1 domain-containing protein n=1 Tax=Cytospora leucostoma TaxID=1230097 RepID=A0A423X4P5_9PEZI|nr:hypothetical protein VPNG_05363 [Cytospora leucostoma]
MKTSVRLALAGVFIHAANAVVQFPFAKHVNTVNTKSDASSTRRRAVNADLFWGDMQYAVNISIGTPAQSVSLLLSPSGSDTWVLDARSSQCALYHDDYSSYYDDDEYNTTDSSSTSSDCLWGSFSSNLSSSYKPQDLNDDEDYSFSYDFYASYDDGSYAYGDYFNDVITLGGATVSNLTIGLVNETDMYIGVLGIGYNDSTHDTLPDLLLGQGLINSTAYSIWVDDEQASSGNLLFGAIDTTKFDGTLARVTSYNYQKMAVAIASINATTKDSDGPISITYSDTDDYSSSSSSSSDYLFTAAFSPPDSVSYLPSDVASQIWEIAGAYYKSNADVALISCSAANDTTTTFSLRLGQGIYGPIITATVADLVVPHEAVDLTVWATYYIDDDPDVCLFGVQNSTSAYGYSSSSYNLGSTLLRRTYSVFDLVNGEIAVAPVKFGATATSNIVPFSAYGASVPSSTKHCIYSDCYETSSDGTDSDDSDSSSSTVPPGVLSLGAVLGISLGIGLGALALGIAGFLFWGHRRNKNKNGGKETASALSAEAGEAPPLVPARSAAGEAGAAPEMAETAVPPAVYKGKGKAPESSTPATLDPVEERPETSATAEADSVQGAAPVQPSSSRDV